MNLILLFVAAAFPVFTVLLARHVYPTVDLPHITFIWWMLSPVYAAGVAFFGYRTGRADECDKYDPDVLEAFFYEEDEHDKDQH